MKTSAFAIALLMGSAAIAQPLTPPDENLNPDTTAQPTAPLTPESTAPDTSVSTTDETIRTDENMPATTTEPTTATTDMASNMQPPAGSPIVQPGNDNPEKDARGIAVISDAATVPAGWNGIVGTAEGGPLVDPATGETITSEEDYPACSASVTDNCLQTYERGRSA